MTDSSFSHVALLVPSVERSAKFLNSKGIKTQDPEVFESEGTKEVYVGSYDSQKGLLLLVEPLFEGPYKRAMIKRGPSLHHIALDVLDIEAFSLKAQDIGWKVHPISSETISYKTAWFYLEGVPTLLEVHQKPGLSLKPLKVARLEVPIKEEHRSLFEGVGLGNIVFPSSELSLTVDNSQLSFVQILSYL